MQQVIQDSLNRCRERGMIGARQCFVPSQMRMFVGSGQQERAMQAWLKFVDLIVMCMRSGYQHHALLQ